MKRETKLERALRLAGGIAQLARAAGVTRQAVYNWIETGPTRYMEFHLDKALRKLEEDAAA